MGFIDSVLGIIGGIVGLVVGLTLVGLGVLFVKAPLVLIIGIEL